jgi:2-polyprenyl-3-methyl-5-hydroxy-6-metoxy-1,4-benzoquinol methylase
MMFAKRSKEKERLDLGPEYYDQEEYLQCLKKLFQVNKLFGFFKSTVKSLAPYSEQSTLLDVGCGSGLFILHLSKIFPNIDMQGVDISMAAIIDAKQTLLTWQKTSPIRVSFKLQEHIQPNLPENSVDIILATLVCHHLSDDELVIFLQQMYMAATKAVIINDLHRHPLAYYLYALVSPWLFQNRLITQDGLISICRGFTRAEWRSLLRRAGIHHYQLKWHFPFRWKLILKK